MPLCYHFELTATYKNVINDCKPSQILDLHSCFGRLMFALHLAQYDLVWMPIKPAVGGEGLCLSMTVQFCL